VPAIAWSRYVLDHHSPAQGVEGALLGFVLPLLIFRWMGVTGRHEQLNLKSVFLAAMKVGTTLYVLEP